MHQAVLEKVTDFMVEAGFSVKGLDFSPIQGGHGNVEFLAYLEKRFHPENLVKPMITTVVETAQKNTTYIYELPKSASTSLKLGDNNILDFELLRNMINLRLVPGSTAFVKRQIVEDFSDDIFSILADDDTILLIFRNEEMAHKVLEEIKNW